MKLLLISNSTNFGEPYLAWCQTMVDLFCRENAISVNSNILFFPFAGIKIGGEAYPESYNVYEKRVQNVFTKWGYNNVHSVHHCDNKAELAIEKIEKADCILVGGGNTFHLAAEMHTFGLIDAVKKRVIEGIPYIGWSAGSNLACPTICTTNDMPVVEPKSFKGLNLIPFQINPHYLDPSPEIDRMIKHGGETRQDRLNEYLAVNQEMTVVGLREASALWVTGNRMTLRGGKKAVILRYGQDEKEIEPGDNVSLLLS
ncbi:MAG: dipeptidase PepE [Bacteroidales bacterium]|jgi:dipeptidase E|nr:dipeptidase PepE [Bacteroidales bacterium]